LEKSDLTPDRLLSLPAITAVGQIIDGHFSTHARLDDFFGVAGIEIADAPSIAKKIRATLNRANSSPAEYEGLTRLVEQLADPRIYSVNGHEVALADLNKALRGDGMEIRCIGEVYKLVATGTDAVAAAALQEKAATFDLTSVQKDFCRALSQAEHDPEDAITAACSTVESVCKCILDESGVSYPAKQDIQHLSNQVAKQLGLSPARTDLPAELAQDLKQVLGGLQSVANGIGALRSHFGDAHGRGTTRAPVDARIARLAIHSANTISLFYIETWQRATAAAAKK
jgi:hypothetical protein